MLYAGVDLGGTNIKVALVTEEGKVVCEGSRPTRLPRPAEEICADIAGLVDEVLTGTPYHREEIAALGIGCPGTVDEKGNVVYANNLEWQNFPAGEILHRMTGLPVAVGNDANVAALGEALFGCARGAQSAVIVTLGTGVGGGIIMDGHLVSGFNGAGSELGHMVVQPGGVPCTCGQHGCLEMYASATGLLRMTQEAMDHNPDSAMHTLAQSQGFDGRLAFDAARQGDHAAQTVVNDYLHYLGMGLSNLINILFPEVIGLSGGVANQGEALLVPLRKIVEPAIYGHEFADRKTRLVCCTLGYHAGMIGAAMLAKQHLEEGRA